jgi:hypothetical protein
MKNLLFALTLLIGPVFGKDEVIKPLVGSSFGEVFVAKVEFVEKGASYIEQNLIKQPWLAKVISVNGQTLDKPVVIEYSLEAGTVTKGKVYEFKAYEDIYQLGTPRGWEERIAQIDYHIRHRLNLRPIVMPKQGRE